MEIRAGLHEIETTVAEAGALGGGWFGRADVHAAIDEHGVGGEDAGVQFRGEQVRHGGFPGGRRTAQHERFMPRGGH